MKFKYTIFTVLFVSILMAAPPPDGEVTVEAGTTYNGNISTDTGDITVFAGARVKGTVESNSGDIIIEDDARVKKIIALNGDVFIEEGVTVDQSITLTNGDLRVKANSTLNGDVINSSGDIRIYDSYLKKSIKNRHGDVILKGNTYVKKDIIILDRGNTSGLQALEIYLGTGVEVNGDVTADNSSDLVELEVFGADINGDIDNITVLGEGDEDDEDGGDEEDEEDEEDVYCGGRTEWSKNTQYYTNDEVYREGKAYRAKKNSKKKDPKKSKNAKYWTNLGDC